MTNKILIDASQPEETRVVVLRDERIEEFDFENANRRPLRGNIYLAKVVRVEPSLQAAFVEYGENRHGFLAFSEIHQDYYQIPAADRRTLLEAHEMPIESAREEGHEEEWSAREGEMTEDPVASMDFLEAVQIPSLEGEILFEESESLVPRDSDSSDVETIASEEEAIPSEDENLVEGEAILGSRTSHRHYAIQEVIKRRQVLLVQVMKEERGSKGAALTTYLSLAGRYAVLMPNTPRGGGISRKITGTTDRLRLKEILGDLEIPDGMSMILRTAGASRTKAEVHRDFDYLLRLWERVREVTLHSSAPMLVYEDGSLIKRAIRDLYDENINEILVEGEIAYREAYDFMHMLLPKNTSAISLYKDPTPLFVRYNVVPQLDSMLEHRVTLPSGGSIVIMQTEALVSIDVNSGRSTREHTIESTAFKTNLEAAEEVARQLRLRDLSGLIVIDFIDMEDRRNIRGVEHRLQESLKCDRARIQVGHISNFGLLEMSRQRLRNSVLESSTIPCTHCGGLGFLRSTASVSVHILHALEEVLGRDARRDLVVHTQPERALYLLNQKRARLYELEQRFGVHITISSDLPMEASKSFILEQGHPVATVSKRGDTRGRGEVTLDTVVPYAVMDEQEGSCAVGSQEEGERSKELSEQRSRRRRSRRRRGSRDSSVRVSSEAQVREESVNVQELASDEPGAQISSQEGLDHREGRLHRIHRSRSRRSSGQHRSRPSRVEIASLERGGLQGASSLEENTAPSEKRRERELVDHGSSGSAAHIGQSDRPKRTGWWARARATLTGETQH